MHMYILCTRFILPPILPSEIKCVFFQRIFYDPFEKKPLYRSAREKSESFLLDILTDSDGQV